MIALLLILAAVIVVQHDAPRAPFVANDYPLLDQAARQPLSASLVQPDPTGSPYRPVSRQVWFRALGGREASPATFHTATLVLFVLSVAMLWGLGAQLAGWPAGTIAAAVFGLHYAADVPLRWASGSAPMIATFLALSTVCLHRAGWRWPAALTVMLAALAQETALVAPVIAVLLDHRDREPWGKTLARARPLALATLLAVAAIATAAWRGLGAPPLGFTPGAIASAFTHFAHVLVGLEWGPGGVRSSIPSAGIAFAAAAIIVALAALWSARKPRSWSSRPSVEAGGVAPERAFGVGLAWALIAAATVAATARTWSAHDYAFALCGMALALGVMLSRAPRALAVVVVVALVLGSDQARRAGPDEAEARSSFRSYIHRAGLERDGATDRVAIDELRRVRPKLPQRATLFFPAGPELESLRLGDGAPVRCAYGDTTLRVDQIDHFTAADVARGPVLFFTRSGGTLEESSTVPQLGRLALGMVHEEQLAPAADLLRYLQTRSNETWIRYWLAWVERERGRETESARWLAQLGMQVPDEASPRRKGPGALLLESAEHAVAGDTTTALRVLGRAVREHPLDPTVHGRLADLATARRVWGQAAVESYAARVLAPEHPRTWRRWAAVMLEAGREEQAEQALERYLALAGHSGRRDREVKRLMANLREETLASIPDDDAP